MYEKTFVYETKLSKGCFKTRNRAGVNVRLAQNDDILRLAIKFKKFRGGKAEKRLKVGHLCFIAEKNGNIVNYTWVCFNETFIDELERKIRIGSDSAYRYDGYTVPKYRGMGILPTVLTKATDHLFQNGIKKIYDFVTSANLPSQRSLSKIGSRKMGEVTLIRLLRSRRYIFKGQTTKDYAKLMNMFSN